MQKNLLVVCGQTATGKTKLALELAQKFNGEIISADSRQVYIGMDIGTGKDVPKSAWQKDHYQIDNIKVWGLDIVDPTEEFSVSQFVTYAQNIVDTIWAQSKLPIIVGGTGFYIKALIDGIDTLSVPQDKHLREELSRKTTDQLFEQLNLINSEKALLLNESDKKNPARLVRAIEVAIWKEKNIKTEQTRNLDADILFIGLTSSKELLHKRISERVQKRIDNGVEGEIQKLLKNGVSWDMQSMQTLGYREWRKYFENSSTLEDVVSEWVRDEEKYAKRQMTWFKKDLRVQWFQTDNKNYQNEVEKSVKAWHTLQYGEARQYVKN